MTTAPADVFDWLGLPLPEAESAALESMAKVCTAVDAHIGRIYTPTAPTDDEPDPDLSDWDLAHVMAAARLYQRRKSPAGVIDLEALGAIRVGRLDSDVQGLLAPFAPLGFA